MTYKDQTFYIKHKLFTVYFDIFMVIGAMFAGISTAEASFKMVFFREYQKAMLVEVKISLL